MPQIKSKNNEDNDESEGPVQGGAPFFPNKPLARLHNLYLIDSIREPEYYAQWFDLIRTSRENDVIYIHINSPGGSMWTALQMMRVMNESQATIVASVEGMCYSSATFILLTAAKVEISNHSMFLFHNFSAMAVGKGSELFEQVNAGKKWSTKLIDDVYLNFLTADELISLHNDKDLWLDSDQVIERLRHRAQVQKAEALKQQAEDEKKVTPTPSVPIAVPVVPKKRKSKKPKETLSGGPEIKGSATGEGKLAT